MGGSSSSKPITMGEVATGMQFQSSMKGSAIPLAYGRVRLSPNIVWYGDFVAIPHTSVTGSGGKGGGGSPKSLSYTYSASFIMALCEGPATAVSAGWINKAIVDPADYFSIFLGSYAQNTWSYLAGAHPDQAFPYRGTAYVAAANYDLGDSAALANHNFEVIGLLPFNTGAGIDDASAKDIIVDLVTSASHGLGQSASLFGDLTRYSDYCVANGLFFSPLYSEPQPVSALIDELVGLTNSGIYCSGDIIKIVPYGDTTVSGNGATFTPDLTPVATLGDDDYIAADDEDPVVVRRNDIADTGNTTADAYNLVQVEFLDRANQYQADIAKADDQVAIDDFGLRPMPTITAHLIALGEVAQTVAQLKLQRSVYTRNQYEFRLGWRWVMLEPTDLLLLNESVLGFVNKPVRVLTVSEDESGVLTVTAEDAPPGVASHQPAIPPTASAFSIDYNVAPGNIVTPVFMEPPVELTTGTGLEVWVGLSGASQNWGGANVWVSYDGSTYKMLGTANGPARIGMVGAGISAASTGPLAVQLSGLGGQILSASAAEAAALESLIYIGGGNHEFLAYQSATLTGTNAYSLGGLVRAAYGSAGASHLPGDPFLRIDDAVVKSGQLDLALVGKTIHFKFQSFNTVGGGLQDLASLPVFDYTINGYGAIGKPVSGLTATAVPGSNVLTELSWDASPGAISYQIDQSADGLTWRRTGETVATTWTDSSLYGQYTRFRVAAVRALAGTWSSMAFLNISYIGMWTIDTAPMWNANSNTPMWST